MLPGRGGDRKMGWAQEHPLTHLLAPCVYHASQGWEESKVRSNDVREGKEDSVKPADSTCQELKVFWHPQAREGTLFLW